MGWEVECFGAFAANIQSMGKAQREDIAATAGRSSKQQVPMVGEVFPNDFSEAHVSHFFPLQAIRGLYQHQGLWHLWPLQRAASLDPSISKIMQGNVGVI